MIREIEILIVDESQSQAEELKHTLEVQGHKVSVEQHPNSALADMRQHKPQIVISGVGLREMDGFAFCEAIKADPNLKDIPVILLTSLSDAKDILRGLQCGADNFFTKPYDPDLLLSRIEYILLNRQLRVEGNTQAGLEVILKGEKYYITPERQQMVDLLISAYETAVQKNLELLKVEQELNKLNESLEEKVRERTGELMAEVADRILTEEALIESERRLQQSQKMEAIGTLAGGVAHDFNNLLTAILGNTQLALHGLKPDDPTSLRLLEVEKAGNRATLLTRQLLAFGRRQFLERRAIDINITIGEISTLLLRIIGEDVDVQFVKCPGLSVIFADPTQIEQVIMNLAVNARDAMPNGGKLIIETSDITLDETYRRQYPDVNTGKYVQVTVSDAGVGMDAQLIKRIFEPFFTTKEVDKGTGLGLSMVYGIIKQHGGHINVYSEVGHGTTFKIFLPVFESPVEDERRTSKPLALGGTETILVAEDEEALRDLARDVLEALGYTVLMARNGKEAVQLFQLNRDQIDLLLLDVVMPVMGGWEASEQIRELGRNVPIILMTGYSVETMRNAFANQNKSPDDIGAVLLQKPYNIEGLGRRVREVLDARSL